MLWSILRLFSGKPALYLFCSKEFLKYLLLKKEDILVIVFFFIIMFYKIIFKKVMVQKLRITPVCYSECLFSLPSSLALIIFLINIAFNNKNEHHSFIIYPPNVNIMFLAFLWVISFPFFTTIERRYSAHFYGEQT